jgi:hypothetical protein
MSANRIFSKIADLTDKATADLPAINTPLGEALAARVKSVAITEGDYALITPDAETLYIILPDPAP